MKRRFRPTRRAIDDLITVMAALRSPQGCPWDREQDHRTLRFHAVEEVYELLDAIESGDDHEMAEELGDLLLQVVFHCQLGRERGAFDFDRVARHIVDKLVRRHPHVFADASAKTVDAVWTQWEIIKRAEKQGTRHARPSALDGIPLVIAPGRKATVLTDILAGREEGTLFVPQAGRLKGHKRWIAFFHHPKGALFVDDGARKANLLPARKNRPGAKARAALARELFALSAQAQAKGWSAEELLRGEVKRQERALRRRERAQSGSSV